MCARDAATLLSGAHVKLCGRLLLRALNTPSSNTLTPSVRRSRRPIVVLSHLCRLPCGSPEWHTRSGRKKGGRPSQHSSSRSFPIHCCRYSPAARRVTLEGDWNRLLPALHPPNKPPTPWHDRPPSPPSRSETDALQMQSPTLRDQISQSHTDPLSCPAFRALRRPPTHVVSIQST